MNTGSAREHQLRVLKVSDSTSHDPRPFADAIDKATLQQKQWVEQARTSPVLSEQHIVG